MIRLMDSPVYFSGPVNIDNLGGFAMLELTEIVMRQVRRPSKIIFMPLPADDPGQRQPNIALAQSKLGRERTASLEGGLKERINYFRKPLKL